MAERCGALDAGAAFSLPLFDAAQRAAPEPARPAPKCWPQQAGRKALALALEGKRTAPSRNGCSWSRHAELREAHQLAQESARMASGALPGKARKPARRSRSGTHRDGHAEQLVTAHRDVAIATAHGYTAMAGGFDGPVPR